MKSKIKEMVHLTEEDYFNIMGWWIGATMLAESGIRSSIRDSERDTINKISEVKKNLDRRKKK